MPFYHRLGEIPHKRHVQFKKPDGKLYRDWNCRPFAHL